MASRKRRSSSSVRSPISTSSSGGKGRAAPSTSSLPRPRVVPPEPVPCAPASDTAAISSYQPAIRSEQPGRMSRRSGSQTVCWLVIDMNATLVAPHSDKEGAVPIWKKSNGFHPLGPGSLIPASAWPCCCGPGRPGRTRSPITRRCWLRPAAGPGPVRCKILVRVDGAGASHELIKHLLSLSSARRRVLFTCGWMITAADEDAIRQVPAGRVEARYTPGPCDRGGQGRREGHAPDEPGRELAGKGCGGSRGG